MVFCRPPCGQRAHLHAGSEDAAFRALFLDRGGVLNRTWVREGIPHPPASLEELEILPGVPEALNALKAAGYATGHFGEWHLGHEPFDPLHQSFDVDVPHHAGPCPPGTYFAPWDLPPGLGFAGAPG